MDRINAVSNMLNQNIKSTDDSKVSGKGFEAFFDAALDVLNKTNDYQIEAEKLQTDYVIGNTDDIIALNMAQMKAATSLQFTTQVTNKILSAYQEIMRMSL